MWLQSIISLHLQNLEDFGKFQKHLSSIKSEERKVICKEPNFRQVFPISVPNLGSADILWLQLPEIQLVMKASGNFSPHTSGDPRLGITTSTSKNRFYLQKMYLSNQIHFYKYKNTLASILLRDEEWMNI